MVQLFQQNAFKQTNNKRSPTPRFFSALALIAVNFAITSCEEENPITGWEGESSVLSHYTYETSTMYAIKDEHRHMHPGSLPFLSSDEGTFDPESLMLLVPGRVMAKMPKASLLKNSNQAAEVPGNEWMPENLEDMEILVYNGTQSSGELFGDVDWSEHTVENDSLVVTDST